MSIDFLGRFVGQTAAAAHNEGLDRLAVRQRKDRNRNVVSDDSPALA